MATKQLIASLGLDTSEFTSKLGDAKSLLGTFAKAVKQQVAQLKEFAVGLKAAAVSNMALASSMTASQIAMKAVILTSKALKIALISTGVGAIVVALGALIAYLTTTQAGMDKLRQVTEPVAQVFGRLLGVLQDLGGNVFKGIAQMLNGDLKEGFATLANGAKAAGAATVNAFKDGIKAGGELAAMTVAIEEAEIALIETKGKLNQEIAEATEQSRNQLLSEKQREVFAKKAISLIGERVDAESGYIDMQIERMKLEQKANDTDRTGFKELALLGEQKRALIEAASKERVRLNNIANKADADELKGAKEINRELGFKVDLISRARRAEVGDNQGVKYSEETLKNVSLMTDKLLNPALKGAIAAGVIIPQEHLDRVAAATDQQIDFNKEMTYAGAITGALGQTLQATFEAMVTSGKVGFSTLINGIKALIIKLVAAAAAAFALNLLLGGIGLGGSTFGAMSGFKDLFSNLSGLPKFANGGMVTGMTTAILGDNPSGKEAVIPFEKMGSFLNKFGGGGSGRVEVFGRLLGQDIFLSGNNYQQKTNKIIAG
jgi:hypothetical protein